MLHHPLTNFGNNVSSIKDWAYIINLDEGEPIGTHWIALYVWEC